MTFSWNFHSLFFYFHSLSDPFHFHLFGKTRGKKNRSRHWDIPLRERRKRRRRWLLLVVWLHIVFGGGNWKSLRQPFSTQSDAQLFRSVPILASLALFSSKFVSHSIINSNFLIPFISWCQPPIRRRTFQKDNNVKELSTDAWKFYAVHGKSIFKIGSWLNKILGNYATLGYLLVTFGPL